MYPKCLRCISPSTAFTLETYECLAYGAFILQKGTEFTVLLNTVISALQQGTVKYS